MNTTLTNDEGHLERQCNTTRENRVAGNLSPPWINLKANADEKTEVRMLSNNSYMTLHAELL